MKLTAEEIRKIENQDLLQRMKNPEDTLARVNQSDVAFQPRPIIKKDKRAIAKLYGNIGLVKNGE